MASATRKILTSTALVAALVLAGSRSGAGAQDPTPAAPAESEDVLARLSALLLRVPLSAHAAGVAQQAKGVAGRLRAARSSGAKAEAARLERLLRSLVVLAEATQARDEERALFETAARRLADVESQLEHARSDVARSADAGSEQAP